MPPVLFWVLFFVIPIMLIIMYTYLYLKRRYKNHMLTYFEWKTTHSNPAIVLRYLPMDERAALFKKATSDGDYVETRSMKTLAHEASRDMQSAPGADEALPTTRFEGVGAPAIAMARSVPADDASVTDGLLMRSCDASAADAEMAEVAPATSGVRGSARRMSRARAANEQRRLNELPAGSAANIMAESVFTPGRGSAGPVRTRV